MPPLKRIRRVIGHDYDGYLLLKYLKVIQPNWTKVFSIKMIRTKNALVNGKRSSIDYKLKMGDVIEIYGSESPSRENVSLNLKRLKKLNVVFENEHLIIVDKEEKMAVQSDEQHSFNNMNNRLLNHLNYDSNSESWKPVFVHRLDYNTTGLLIGAKTYKAYLEINKAMKEQKISKNYKALVHGLVKFKEKTVKCFLLKKENKVEIVSSDTKGAKESITEVNLIKHCFDSGSSLLHMKLITGRTHQIRAHMQYIQHPIRGDQKYGVEKEKKKYPFPALCAYMLEFSDDLEGDTLSELRGRVFEKKDIWFENLS